MLFLEFGEPPHTHLEESSQEAARAYVLDFGVQLWIRPLRLPQWTLTHTHTELRDGCCPSDVCLKCLSQICLRELPLFPKVLRVEGCWVPLFVPKKSCNRKFPHILVKGCV